MTNEFDVLAERYIEIIEKYLEKMYVDADTYKRRLEK